MRHVLKGFGVVILLSGLLYFAWSQYQDFLTRGQRPPKGTLILNEIEKTGVPDFILQDLNEKPVQLSSFNDKLVIVNFWASWCEPCVKEFPSLMRLLEVYPDDLVLLAVSADNTIEDLRGFTKAFGVERVRNWYTMWDKEQKVAAKYGTEVLPESYIVGKNLKLIRKVAGVEEWDSPMAIKFFKDIIEENKK